MRCRSVCHLPVLNPLRDGVVAAWCGVTRLVNTPLAGDAFFCCSIPLLCSWSLVSRFTWAHSNVSAVRGTRSAEQVTEGGRQ